MMESNTGIQIVPATAEHWYALQTLFGANGAYAGCWCMFWRLNRADFKAMKGEGTKEVLRQMVVANEVPGLLAYQAGDVVGWCSVGPREQFLALDKSRILKRVDAQPVWSIACFYVAKSARKQGLMVKLRQGAVAYAQSNGAQIVEGYPIDMQIHVTGYAGYMGFASAYRQAGFVEVGKASETQLIMRFSIPSEDMP